MFEQVKWEGRIVLLGDEINLRDDTVFDVNVSVKYAILVDDLSILNQQSVLGTLQQKNKHFF